MNFEMADTSVQQHMREVRNQAARARGHQATPTTRRHPSGLRGRLGITLIEAGLHLLAADGPQGRV
jgi:hypothetical protein